MGASLHPLMIVTELMEGSIDNIIESNVKYSLPFLLKLAIDCARGLSWLHSLQPMIIHRDVKPENFLYDHNYRVVIADFGLSEKLKKGDLTWDLSAGGTLSWAAPEIAKQTSFDEKSDIFSLSLVIYSLITRRYPFASLDNVTVREFITKVAWEKFRPDFPSDVYVPNELVELITCCWDDDPKQRWDAVKVTEKLCSIRRREAITDEKARVWWDETWPTKSEVTWDQFSKKFLPSQGLSEDQIKMQTMMFLQKGTIRGNEPLTDERFGLCVSWFGFETEFQRNLEEIITNPAFFGDQSARRVSELLSAYSEGTYLVRFVTTSHGRFAVDWTKNGQIHEFIVRREATDGGSQQFWIEGSAETKAFASLKDLIASCPQLVSSCPRPPFLAFYTETLPFNHLI
eukprot:TRINITY_DN2652_c0_g1_i3.p1 TRINITY_DN2652_c0_g1~~TRINITY_DN2652_c0_g1_i3.p1  ORF type:complete len:400 (+),score=74.60 TRINITY_DN2652_c0_g1_i3:214-1413(+)